MNFLNPLVLFGLFAASIPVLIHLLNLRRQKTVEFSSLKFLKELQKTKIRRLKIRQILLLIIRSLIIIFAVLAFTRPTTEGTLPLLESYSNASTVIIFDNSFSLNISDEYGNRFSQTKSAAIDIVNSLNEGDEIAFLEMTSDNTSNLAFTGNFDQIIGKINSTELSYKTASLFNTLKIAISLLEESKNINKDIFIISDAQANIFERNLDTNKLKTENLGIYFLPIGSESNISPDNLNIDSVNIETRIFQIGKNIQNSITIHNHSDNNREEVVLSQFFNNERISQRSFDINAQSQSVISLTAESKYRGIVKSKISLEPDALDIDNNYYYSYYIPDNLKIAVLSDRTNFLEASINSFSNDDFLSADYYDIANLGSINIEDYRLLILSGLNYNESNMARIRNYLENGGSCMIFASEKEESNIESMQILELANIKSIEFGIDNPGKFSNADLDHPIFEGVYKLDKNTEIESPNIYEAKALNSGQKIISLQGNGFLNEIRIGKGKLFYFAVSPDLEMSNFPITGLFPTLIYRSIIYLTASSQLSSSYYSGDEISFSIPSNVQNTDNLKLISPEGVDTYIQSAQLPTGAFVELGKLELPGNYSLIDSDGRTISLFSINVEPSESNLVLKSNKEITNLMKRYFDKGIEITFIKQDKEVEDSIIRARAGSELWQLFILLAIVFALFELFIQRILPNKT